MKVVEQEALARAIYEASHSEGPEWADVCSRRIDGGKMWDAMMQHAYMVGCALEKRGGSIVASDIYADD